jgi:elongation of very long chain fatty acids protein 6
MENRSLHVALEPVIPYSTPMLSFERNFDYDAFHSWIVRNWTVTFVYAAVYVTVIFAGRAYMSNRPRLDIRVPLIIWSCVLAVFSIAGAVRTVPELFYLMRRYGIEESVCRSVLH